MNRCFKSGGVSQCFHCGRQLVRIMNGFIFVEIMDPDGNRMRVHKGCQAEAIGDGYKAAPPILPIRGKDSA